MTPVLLREVRANAEAPLIASSETRRQRLVKPEEDEGEQVGLAPPDGFEPPTRTLGECRSIH